MMVLEQLETHPATRIREIRQGLGISQERLARILSVSAKTVERWESGQTPPPSNPRTLGTLSALVEIGEIGRLVFSQRGFELFLQTPSEAFGGLTPLQAIELGQASRVLATLAADYEGQWS